MKKSLIFVGLLAIGFANAQSETDYSGRVGINTETPSATLNVKSQVGTTNDSRNFELENAAGTKMMTVFDNGFIGINTDTETLVERLHVKDASIRIEGKTSLGGFLTLLNTGKEIGKQEIMPMWRIYNMGGTYGNSLQFWGYPNHTGRSAGAIQSVLVLSDVGNIGMSVSDPTQRLDVNGNARFRTLPTVIGEATDKVVVVDDTGLLKTVQRSSITSTNIKATTSEDTCTDTNAGTFHYKEREVNGQQVGTMGFCTKQNGNYIWVYFNNGASILQSAGTNKFGEGL